MNSRRPRVCEYPGQLDTPKTLEKALSTDPQLFVEYLTCSLVLDSLLPLQRRLLRLSAPVGLSDPV
jgi:hypothetical protein